MDKENIKIAKKSKATEDTTDGISSIKGKKKSVICADEEKETKLKSSNKVNKKNSSEPVAQQVSTKPKRVIFSLTDYDEIIKIEKEKRQSELRKRKNENGVFANSRVESIEFTSRDILDMLNNENINLENEDIFISLIRISKLGMRKQGTVCREVINIIKHLVLQYDEPKTRWSNINKFLEIINKLTCRTGGLHNSFKFIKNVLEKTQNKEVEKMALISKLDEYISTKINTKEYISDKHGINLVKENDCILIYGKSQIFRKILIKAVNRKVNFKVVYVDNRQNNYIKTEAEFLSQLGVNVTYSYLNGISGIIDKVTKVFVKAKSMLSNGSLLGEVGTSLIALIANNFKKPVISFCETYKFWDKIFMNSFQSDNLLIENVKSENSEYSRLNIQYDVTPANYINMVVCEHGYIPPTSVPVVIREIEKEEVEFD